MCDQDNDNEFVIPFVQGIYRNVSETYRRYSTRQYGKLTDINLVSVIDSFVKTVGPVNHLSASADKRTEWLRETYPNIEVVPPTGIPLDLQIEGGGRRVHVESELGGAKAIAHDRKKLTYNDVPSDASIMFWRQMSRNQLDHEFENIRRESIDKDQVLVGVEAYLPNKAPISDAGAHVVAFRNGNTIFDSNDPINQDENDEDIK